MGDERATVSVVSVKDQAAEIDELWSPLEVARANDQVVRLAKIQGEYHWHRHNNEDELFYVLEGSIVLQLENQPDVVLGEGEMAVVPRGVEHCPMSEGVSCILMFEPSSLESRGD